MNILAVTNFFPPFHGGGYGLLCGSLCEGMAARGHQITVLTGESPTKKDVRPGADAAPCEVLRCLRPVTWRQSTAQRLLAAMRNRRIVHDTATSRHFDVNWIFSLDGIGIHSVAPLLKGKGSSVFVMGDTWLTQALKSPVAFDPLIAALSLSWRRPRAIPAALLCRLRTNTAGITSVFPQTLHPDIHAISSFLLDSLAGTPHCPSPLSRVIPVPIHPCYFGAPTRARLPAEHLRVLSVSRLEPGKGQDTALYALAKLRNMGVGATLTLVGMATRKSRTRLEAMIDELGLGDIAAFVDAPTAERLREVYLSHDVFVFPSRIVEGFGIVCAEAMACGLPVIGTDTGGQRDAIKNGHTGFLIPSRGHEELAAYLALLAANRDLLESLSRNALKHSRRYTPDVVFAASESLLDEVLSRNG